MSLVELKRKKKSDTKTKNLEEEKIKVFWRTITPDKKMEKRVITKGTGSRIPVGSVVTYKFTSGVVAEEDTYNTWVSDTEDSLRLGSDEHLEGLHIAIATMKNGECSEFLIGHEYAYGEMGIYGIVPPNSTMYFKITVLSCSQPTDLEAPENRSNNAQLIEDALVEKSDGNKLLSLKIVDLKKVLNCYHRGINFLSKTKHPSPQEKERIEGLFQELYLLCSSIFLQLEDFPKAVTYCDLVLKINDKSGMGFLNRGIANTYLEFFDEALHDLETALHLLPSEDQHLACQKLEDFKVRKKKYHDQYKALCTNMFAIK